MIHPTQCTSGTGKKLENSFTRRGIPDQKDFDGEPGVDKHGQILEHSDVKLAIRERLLPLWLGRED